MSHRYNTKHKTVKAEHPSQTFSREICFKYKFNFRSRKKTNVIVKNNTTPVSAHVFLACCAFCVSRPTFWVFSWLFDVFCLPVCFPLCLHTADWEQLNPLPVWVSLLFELTAVCASSHSCSSLYELQTTLHVCSRNANSMGVFLDNFLSCVWKKCVNNYINVTEFVLGVFNKSRKCSY